jgi:hypothetical protein
MKRFCLSALFIVLLAAPASAGWSRGYLPPCDSGDVLILIRSKFAYADRTFHWGVKIGPITDIYERPMTIRAPKSLIARRYCGGTAWLTDGSRSEVYYLIESRQGFVSIGYSVESCLPAFDPWRTYDGWCRAARP